MNDTRAGRPHVATRAALIEAGTQLILEKGYNHAGLDEILRDAGVHKGSFYHFFKSKEDFGLQIVAEYAAQRLASLDEQLNNHALRPLDRLRRFYELAGQRHQRLGYRKGCLFGNLGQEMADQSEVFRTRLEAVLSEYRARIARCFREAQEVGDLRTDLDVDRLAGFCLNSWEGALLRMKVAKSYEPLDDFLFFLFETVLKHPLPPDNLP